MHVKIHMIGYTQGPALFPELAFLGPETEYVQTALRQLGDERWALGDTRAISDYGDAWSLVTP